MSATVIDTQGQWYNKYRPLLFKDVIENENTIKDLKGFLKTKTGRPHTYLFWGPPGSGKTTLARIFAKKLGPHPWGDFLEKDAASYRGIETIRGLMKIAVLAPKRRARIFLFDEAHQLTNDAQEALLKLVEEPPPRLYLMFCTTKPRKLIETLRDRCMHFGIKPLSRKGALDLIRRVCQAEGKKLPQNTMSEIADFSKNARVMLNNLQKACLRY